MPYTERKERMMRNPKPLHTTVATYDNPYRSVSNKPNSTSMKRSKEIGSQSSLITLISKEASTRMEGRYA